MLFGAGEAVAVALKGLLHKVTLCVEHGQQHITIQHAVVVNLGAPATEVAGSSLEVWMSKVGITPVLMKSSTTWSKISVHL